MKTRRLQHGLGSILILATWLAAGCGATAVSGKEKAETAAPSAPVAVAVPEAPGPTNSVPGTNSTEAAAASSAPAPVQVSRRPDAPLPEDIGRVVQLVESGAGEEVVRAYVGTSNARYDLSLEQIIYLRDIGIPDGVIAAMMRRGSELREKDAEAAASAATNAAPAVAQKPEGAPANAAPSAGTPPPPPADGTPPVAVQTVQAPVEAPVAVQQFYAPLTPYGTWYQVPTYGWVWQPSAVVVDPGWMPYRHGGRWVWSDAGWYWCSDYSWGWAPFHYGRWCTYPGIGWCWTPDTVWGPSWVTWRHCDSHIGWAPLPPACGWSSGIGLTWYGNGVSVGFGFGLAPSCYTFVPSPRFCQRNLSLHVVRGPEHDGVYRRSAQLNNLGEGKEHGVMNNGIGYKQVAAKVGGDVPRARVEPLPLSSREPLRADRMERSKDGFVIYRPTAVDGQAGGRPALRAEVRPTPPTGPSTLRSSVAAQPGRSMNNSPRPAGENSAPPRLDTRGSSSAAPAPAAGASRSYGTPRPSGSASGSIVAPARSQARPYSAPAAGTDSVRSGTRSAPPSATPAERTAPSTSVGARPVAPASPVDPSRSMPTRPKEPNWNVPTPPARPNFTQPGSGSSGAVSAPPVASPSGRSGYSTPAPSVSAPRPTYFAPSASPGGAGSGYSAPRPSYSAPTPSGGAPSAAPSYSAPRPAPSYSAPTPSPSAGAPVANPSGTGSRNAGGRNQPN